MSEEPEKRVRLDLSVEEAENILAAYRMWENAYWVSTDDVTLERSIIAKVEGAIDEAQR